MSSDHLRRPRPACALRATATILSAGLVTSLRAIEIEHDPPVAPILPAHAEAATWLLRTPAVSVVVETLTARLTALIPTGGSNLLSAAGRIWPVPESAWAALRAQHCWPETVFDAPAWTGRAWRTRSGATICRWTRDFGPPISARATRTVRISPYAAAVEMEDRWQRTAPSAIPLGPAVVLRIADPVRLLLPAPAETPPVRPIAFDPPPSFAWLQTAGTWVYRVDLGGEHRVESTRRGPAWAAAEVPGWLVLLRGPAGRQPDALRLRARAYAHRASRTAEIEVAADGFLAPPDATLVLRTTIECFPLAPRMDATALATRTRLLAGEAEAGSAPR
ncbi:MAG: hypothetical protein N2652_10565 [Kiritimatiellae bacterium]|nr:hypothetical protein [Kiritimatiellia bacterium]